MTTTPTMPPGQSWISRNSWIVSVVWLVFLVFPLQGVLAQDSIGTGAKIASATLFFAFAGVYIDGFRRHARGDQHLDLDEPTASPGTGNGAAGVGHFVALLAIAATLFLIIGVGVVGVIPFVVVFAVFHFSWAMASIVFGIGLAVSVSLPLLVGRLSEFSFLAMMVAGVGGAAMLVRAFTDQQFDQALLRTGIAVIDERSRVARDVHDVLGHSLTAVILKVELCQRLLDGQGPNGATDKERTEACQKQLAELETISRQALAEIRSTVGGLRATDISDELTAARTVLADAGVDLLVTGDVSELTDGHRPMLAWVVREAVTNIVRHSGAGQCSIDLAPAEGTVLLRVTDDGIGLGTAGEGNGLRGLRERVATAGGTLRIESPTTAAGNRPTGMDSAGGTMIEVAA